MPRRGPRRQDVGRPLRRIVGPEMMVVPQKHPTPARQQQQLAQGEGVGGWRRRRRLACIDEGLDEGLD